MQLLSESDLICAEECPQSDKNGSTAVASSTLLVARVKDSVMYLFEPDVMCAAPRPQCALQLPTWRHKSYQPMKALTILFIA